MQVLYKNTTFVKVFVIKRHCKAGKLFLTGWGVLFSHQLYVLFLKQY